MNHSSSTASLSSTHGQPQSRRGSQPGGLPPTPLDADPERLPLAQLESVVSDREAYQEFLGRWLPHTQAGRTLREILAQNEALARENLGMQVWVCVIAMLLQPGLTGLEKPGRGAGETWSCKCMRVCVCV